MSKLEALTGRNYLSYSSLQSYLDCGERFRLERVMNAPTENAWWFIGGSAFHTASEYLDRGETTDTAEAWNKAWDLEVSEVDTNQPIKAGGRVSKEWPNKEDGDWWNAKGPGMLDQYVKWRDSRLEEGWQFLPTPGGGIAVELAIQVEFPDVLVKGYIDRVMVNDSGEVLVVDLKTGSHTPASSLQLGIYALGVQRHLGIQPTLGAYYMARKGELSELKSLLHYSEELVGRWFGSARKGIEEELFIPHVTSLCGTCGVAKYCAAVGGTGLVPTASIS